MNDSPTRVLAARRDDLPIVDLAAFTFDETGADRIAGELDRSFGDIGFCYVANTGVPLPVSEAVVAASKRFHAQDAAAKAGVSINEFHRGYLAPKTSQLVTSSVAKVTKPNVSESFMLMHEVTPEDPEWGQPFQGPNQWPADLPGFREAVTTYNAALGGLARRFTRLIARALRLPPTALDCYFEKPTTWLRLLHYPSQGPTPPEDEFGAAPHTDYGFITFLLQDEVGGLEVGRKNRSWLPATPVPGTFVVNVGDMLSRWTNGRWQSTPHRVRNLSAIDRYSVAYFFDPALSTTIACLPTCVNPGSPSKFEPVRYGDYVTERIEKNYGYRRRAG